MALTRWIDHEIPTWMGVVNQGQQLFDDSEVNCVDCTLSDSDQFSHEQASPTAAASYVERKVSEPSESGPSGVGAPRVLAEARIFQRQEDTSAALLAYYYSPTTPTTPYYPDPACTGTDFPRFFRAHSPNRPPQPPLPRRLPTIPPSHQICVAPHIPPSGSYNPFQSTSSCADCPTMSSASGDPPNSSAGFVTYGVAYTTVASTFQIITIATTMLQPLSPTVTSTSIVMVSSPLPQPSAVSDTNSNPQLSPTIGAIIGGTVGAVVLLALLTFVVLHRRRTRQLSVTPFNLLSTAKPTEIESRARLKFQGASGAVRPSSRSSSFIQYSGADLAEHSGSISPSCATDHISSQLPEDVISVSSVARRYRSHELEKLYPYPSPIPASNQHRHQSVQSWVEHIVTDACSQEPSEELPAYPRSGCVFGTMRPLHEMTALTWFNLKRGEVLTLLEGAAIEGDMPHSRYL
ncbi:hypothetical protein EDB19DRAFT_1832347 [Suillus lakei]|nr:hypothetical protein EDB19DRAFT_1832347 [Suillus lakei]